MFNKSKKIYKAAVFAAIFLLMLSGINPNRACCFSVTEEREMGEKLLTIVRKEFKLLDDPDISQYIDKIGREILAAAGSQYFDYHFFLINNKEFNAFAAPSGLIFINSGLVEAMEQENELFSVMAHEIGHAAGRHIANRIDKNKKVAIGTMAGVLAGIVLGGGPLAEALITGSTAAGATMNLKFSRQDEEEADRQAYKLMQEEKRDPAAMVEVLRKMRRIDQYRSGNVPPYLLTHPEPGPRMRYVQDLLLVDREKQYRDVDNFDFLRLKHRLLSLSGDSLKLIPQYMKKAAAEDKSIETRMAGFGLSQAYLAQADFARAEAALDRVITAFPEQPILLADKGVIYFEAGRYTEALKLFEESYRRDPDCSYAVFYLAKTLQKTGQPARAAALYEKLLYTLPDYAKLYFQLGEARAELGEIGPSHYYLGYFNFYEGDQRTAAFHFQQAVDILPEKDSIRKKAEEMLARIKKLE